MNRVSNLIEIGDVIATHADPALASWWSAAVKDYIAGTSLEAALQLESPGPGKPSPRYAYQLEQRDKYLRAAWRLVRRDTQSEWATSEKLAQEIKRFERMWPNTRFAPTAPDRLSELQRHLFAARRLGKLPDVRRLHDLCKES